MKPASTASTADRKVPRCQTCGRLLTDKDSADLCRRCERTVATEIRQGISVGDHNICECPRCKGHGNVLTKVPTRNGLRYGKLSTREEMRQCPVCHGIGHLSATLPPGADIDIAAIDAVGVNRRLLDWRAIDKVGAITGLPHFAGKAFATNGVLIAIRRDDGQVVIGHLDSFVAVEPKAISGAAKSGGRKSAIQKLMEEFA